MNIVEQLKRDEGLRLYAYKCPAGKLTIGYGRCIEKDFGGITEQEAEAMLANDVEKFRKELQERCCAYRVLVGSEQQERAAVLENMAFNMGTSGLLKFEKMLKAVEYGNYEKAAEEMLCSKWATQVGDRAARLSEQMRLGRWI